MVFVFLGLGLFAGFLAALFFDDGGWFASCVGAAFGLVLHRQRRLSQRLAQLERRLVAQAPPMPAPTPAPAEPVARPTLIAPPPAPRPAPPQGAAPPPQPPAPPPPWPVWETAKRWLQGGNLPVKVGMLVLFAGVSALLKHAADEGWLRAPIELRLGGVALLATAGLVFGFRQRTARPAFSLALQGGAIGILTLTVFVAYRLYDLLPAGLAFAILLLLVAATGVLAVVQDARSLGVLATLAGFLAPVLASSGTGSHVALFSWYAIFNLLVLGVAWWRSWRILDLVGIVCTSLFTTAWVATGYRSELLASAEFFVTLFFVIYLAVPVVHARTRRAPSRAVVNATLIFGNPIFYLGMQAVFLHDRPLALALVALGVAAAYLGLAVPLRGREAAGTLCESFAALAVGFATLAVPLALSAQVTAGVFALEGAALVWLGHRQDRRLSRVAGIVLQGLAAVAFLLSSDTGTIALLNGRFWSGLWIVVGAATSAWAARAHGARHLPPVAFGWGLLWWTLLWLGELFEFVPSEHLTDALLAWAAGTTWLLSEAYRATRARALPWVAAAWSVGTLAAAALQVASPPLAGWGSLAWGAALLFGLRMLDGLREATRRALSLAHLAWLLSLATALSAAAAHLGDALGLGRGWVAALGAIPPLGLYGLVLRRPTWVAVPVAAGFSAYRGELLTRLSALLALAFFTLLEQDGAAAPLPFVPLLNPLALATSGWLALCWLWLTDRDAPPAISTRRFSALGAVALVALTAETLRAVRWLGGFAWEPGLLGQMEAQTSLSVVWSAAGVVACVVGSRRGSRGTWFAGATLLGVVLLKLAVVDRTYLGSLAGIVSFLAYGALCTLVGYLAPVPPRSEAEMSS